MHAGNLLLITRKIAPRGLAAFHYARHDSQDLDMGKDRTVERRLTPKSIRANPPNHARDIDS